MHMVAMLLLLSQSSFCSIDTADTGFQVLKMGFYAVQSTLQEQKFVIQKCLNRVKPCTPNIPEYR